MKTCDATSHWAKWWPMRKQITFNTKTRNDASTHSHMNQYTNVLLDTAHIHTTSKPLKYTFRMVEGVGVRGNTDKHKYEYKIKIYKETGTYAHKPKWLSCFICAVKEGVKTHYIFIALSQVMLHILFFTSCEQTLCCLMWHSSKPLTIYMLVDSWCVRLYMFYVRESLTSEAVLEHQW